jgi:hypothetical protein
MMADENKTENTEAETKVEETKVEATPAKAETEAPVTKEEPAVADTRRWPWPWWPRQQPSWRTPRGRRRRHHREARPHQPRQQDGEGR